MVDLEELKKSRDMGGHIDRLYNHCLDVGASNILEIGTRSGVSTKVFLKVAFRNNGNVTSIDIKDCSNVIPSNLKCRWEFIEGDSTIVDLSGNTYDVLFIDGDHTKADKDLERYKRNVRKGGLIILHDSAHEPNVIKTIRSMIKSSEYDITHYPDCFGMTVAEVL